MNKFLSTPSARRATVWPRKKGCQGGISIHALREEGDPCTICGAADITAFLSTPSARRATLSAAVAVSAFAISIHALREEGDSIKQIKKF